MNHDPVQQRIQIPPDIVRPEIRSDTEGTAPFRAGMKYGRALRDIEAGEYKIIQGSFATALAFYSWLRKHTSHEYPVNDHSSSRLNRKKLAERAGHIMIRVRDHKPDMDKAPSNPWLKDFYPDINEFLISLPDLLGMNGARQWFMNGVKYPVLDHRLHPFYGAYFPVRTAHLMLLDNWMNRSMKLFRHVKDIGTGCGIMGFMALKHGAKSVHATDINPNAIFSTITDAGRMGLRSRLTAEQASFFGKKNRGLGKGPGLTLFNPPWIPGSSSNIIDKGIYYEEGFFEEFLADAAENIDSGGIIAVVFSDYAIIAGLTGKNPVETAVSASNHFSLADVITGKVPERSRKRSRSWINRIRENETTGLWILKRT
ncbi:MAG: hypothetical protein EA408_01595 [Marinilabiliales bacterium]|nr:MAG: hypothetical protein EA408_01595 [Marinilabiliales bacterium]